MKFPLESQNLLADSKYLANEIGPRIYGKDASLWSQDQSVQKEVAAFLGWVDAPLRTNAQAISAFAQEIQAAGFTDAVVLGMGGSSLSSLMFAQAFPNQRGLKLHVLDSTVPEDVLRIRNSVPIATTLFIVASKSGSTVEPLAFEEFFYQQLQSELGNQASQNIIAITDPGSQMEARATERNYRRIFLGEPEVGGRFSVFTVFGMMPAALAGLPIAEMLHEAIQLHDRQDQNAVNLGIALAEFAQAGKDKVTFLTPPHLEGIALWAEQLIAESTGKHGLGILPLATEPIGASETYGPDRIFFQINAEHPDFHPSFQTFITNPAELAHLLYTLEIATAAAGAVLHVNPFDQPNVQAAKIIAQRELHKIQATKELPEFSFDTSSEPLHLQGATGQSVGQALANFIHNHNPGDQVAFLAFLPETDETTVLIQTLRAAIRDRLNLATSFGYGPRYLHSTGQYHKGGPNNGLYIVLTSQDAEDPEIPGMGVTFGQLKMAQALGDIGALRDNGRRVVHIHITSDDISTALAQLAAELHIAVAP